MEKASACTARSSARIVVGFDRYPPRGAALPEYDVRPREWHFSRPACLPFWKDRLDERSSSSPFPFHLWQRTTFDSLRITASKGWRDVIPLDVPCMPSPKTLATTSCSLVELYKVQGSTPVGERVLL